MYTALEYCQCVTQEEQPVLPFMESYFISTSFGFDVSFLIVAKVEIKLEIIQAQWTASVEKEICDTI